MIIGTAGFGLSDGIASRRPPEDADGFAAAVILTICSASVAPWAGRRTAERCLQALACGGTARMGLRHPTRAASVDRIWSERHRLFAAYRASADRRRFIATLPGIGPATERALAERLGLRGDAASRAA